MDAIAAEAGVGKGTVFRRFGDRARLALRCSTSASGRSRRTRSAASRRSARCAPPVDRLVAFGHARFDLLERHGLMIAAAEASERGDARFDDPVYVFYRSHIGMLVREANPDCDAEYITEACWPRSPRPRSCTSGGPRTCRSTA